MRSAFTISLQICPTQSGKSDETIVKVALMKIDLSALINAPRERVFGHLTDVAAWPDIIPGCNRVDVLTPGPIMVGTRFVETRTMFGREAIEEMTVSVMEAPSLFIVTAHNHGTAYKVDHILEDVGGQTRLKIIFEGRPESIFAWLFYPLGLCFQGSLKQVLQDDIAAVKAACERET